MDSPDTVLDKSDPGDDVGARFNYQYGCAAINAIALVVHKSIAAEIICENHEDILHKSESGKFVGRQIKTRALTLLPFKTGDAQVQGALQRFCRLDAKFPGAFETFDLTTNHFFWKDQETYNNLPWVLEGLRKNGGIKRMRVTNPIRQLVDKIAAACALKAVDVAATLMKTVVNGHGHDVASIRSQVREALIECPGISELPVGTVYRIADDIIALAREASTKALKGPITDLFAPGTMLDDALKDQQLKGKRLFKADVLAIIAKHKGKSLEGLDIVGLVTPEDVPRDLVRAVRKMTRGSVEAIRIGQIEDLVRAFEALYIQWSRKDGADIAKQRYQSVLGIVQVEAAEARVAAQKAGEPYGAAMYELLYDRLRARVKADPDELFGCRAEHLLGAAGLVTESCKAWWSQEFDAGEGLT